MSDESGVSVPLQIDGGQYAIVTIEVTSGVSDLLSDEDVLASMRSTIDFDKVTADLRRRVKLKQERKS